MDDVRVAELARRQGGLVTTAQLRECGLSASGVSRRVSRGRLFPVLRSVYALGPVVDPRARWWAGILAVGVDRAVLSHWSAGEAHRMLVPRLGPVHVTVTGGGRAGPVGVVVHRSRGLGPCDVVTIGGLRATSPERTTLDVAGLADDRVVHRLIREGEVQGVLAAGAISSSLAGRTGHRGLARLRRVDPQTIDAALGQTPLEDELDALLRRTGLRGVVRQHGVRGASGAWYRADFAHPETRLLIEADGRSVHDRSTAFESDREREADLTAAGWQTLRFTRIQVRTRPETVVRVVQETVGIRSRAGRGSSDAG